MSTTTIVPGSRDVEILPLMMVAGVMTGVPVGRPSSTLSKPRPPKVTPDVAPMDPAETKRMDAVPLLAHAPTLSTRSCFWPSGFLCRTTTVIVSPLVVWWWVAHVLLTPIWVLLGCV